MGLILKWIVKEVTIGVLGVGTVERLNGGVNGGTVGHITKRLKRSQNRIPQEHTLK